MIEVLILGAIACAIAGAVVKALTRRIQNESQVLPETADEKPSYVPAEAHRFLRFHGARYIAEDEVYRWGEHSARPDVVADLWPVIGEDPAAWEWVFQGRWWRLPHYRTRRELLAKLHGHVLANKYCLPGIGSNNSHWVGRLARRWGELATVLAYKAVYIEPLNGLYRKGRRSRALLGLARQLSKAIADGKISPQELQEALQQLPNAEYPIGVLLPVLERAGLSRGEILKNVMTEDLADKWWRDTEGKVDPIEWWENLLDKEISESTRVEATETGWAISWKMCLADFQLLRRIARELPVTRTRELYALDLRFGGELLRGWVVVGRHLRGTFVKRLSQAFYKARGIRLDPDVLSRIGSLLEPCAKSTAARHYRIERRPGRDILDRNLIDGFEFRSNTFSGSCWWDVRWQSRYIFASIPQAEMWLVYEEGQGEPRKFGRMFVINMGGECPVFAGFNQYGWSELEWDRVLEALGFTTRALYATAGHPPGLFIDRGEAVLFTASPNGEAAVREAMERFGCYGNFNLEFTRDAVVAAKTRFACPNCGALPDWDDIYNERNVWQGGCQCGWHPQE